MALSLPPGLLTWNNVLRLVGLLGVAHETVVNNVDRPTLLLLFAAMIGIPSFVKQDSGRREDEQ
jgi:hypothetical protein